MRTFSYGGGVQSTAVLVLASQGKVQYDAFVFANVGEDSENPKTLDYYRAVALPFAEKHNLKMVEVQKTRFGKPETLFERIMRDDRTIPIPMRMNTGAPGRRTCTADFKIYAIGKWIKSNNTNRSVVGLGISIDESHRARSTDWEYDKRRNIWEKKEYPLIDLRLRRIDCMNIIAHADLPIPPRSACYFCPFHRHTDWLVMKKNNPDLFIKAVEIEKFIQAKRTKLGRDKMWMHNSLKPLDVAVGLQNNFFDDMDNCESGYCFT